MTTCPVSRRRVLAAGSAALWPWWAGSARAHHGWSSFDQTRPLYLEGRAATVQWRNPHVELVLELAGDLQLPADLKQRVLPRQTAPVDGPALLAAAQLPTRRDKRWTIELAPLTRVQAWQVPEIQPGTPLAVLGFGFDGEKGEPVLRAEYVFVGGKAYGMRSSPA
ncbi:DUF6152 family protein [Schlegelella sp. S2-27]|uniref:DUF6152 family protein n=1 Tax=Caldimonas mangrovi TaxID=2944811 RepID=A0ABT0YUB4_9BURK|nr:DUF6152 family protein [Caldimonas mangrovi]MCM5682213.1 DUF6152 family protein [Caldimonas mangrovi]